MANAPGSDDPITVRFNRILFATDFSAASAAALPYAAALARHFGSTIYVAHVISPESYAHIPPQERDAVVARMRRNAEERITSLLASAHFKDIPHQVLLDHGDLWPVLSASAEKYEIDLIVSGTHGRHGIQKLFSGSVAEEILRLAERPVLLVGPEVANAPEAEVHLKRILYVTDFSPESRRAMDHAYALAVGYGAQLYFLHVVEDAWAEPLSTRMSADAFFHLRLLENGWPHREEDIEPEYLVEFGIAEELILEAAEKRSIELIVLSVPGTTHPELAAHLPGPLAYNVVSHASCPVLAVRMVEPARSEGLIAPSAAD